MDMADPHPHSALESMHPHSALVSASGAASFGVWALHDAGDWGSTEGADTTESQEGWKTHGSENMGELGDD